MEGLIAITYRCNARCYMCNTWKHPSSPAEELQPKDLETLPPMAFTNITGGEPFVRQDIADFIEVVKPKSRRIVISTNGYFTDRIVALAAKWPDLGFRVSLEGLPAANDELRGIRDGFDHGLRTLLELKAVGVKDLGFGITVSDRNARDMRELYRLAEGLHMEFATAVTHNTYYFHKLDNRFEDRPMIIAEFRGLIKDLFRTRRLKNWFRAYFNEGLIYFIRGTPRPLPCEVGSDLFFVDPIGRVLTCNGNEFVMGSLKERGFDEIWNSEEAGRARRSVADCSKNCWMIGSASPAIKKKKWHVLLWILKNRRKYLRGDYDDPETVVPM
jgi:MoaA/NifB/PqqE/SkfB family radical SAM enzyme